MKEFKLGDKVQILSFGLVYPYSSDYITMKYCNRYKPINASFIPLRPNTLKGMVIYTKHLKSVDNYLIDEWKIRAEIDRPTKTYIISNRDNHMFRISPNGIKKI